MINLRTAGKIVPLPVQPVILAYTVIYILVFIVAFSFFGVPKEHDRTTTERIPDNGLRVKIAVE